MTTREAVEKAPEGMTRSVHHPLMNVKSRYADDGRWKTSERLWLFIAIARPSAPRGMPSLKFSRRPKPSQNLACPSEGSLWTWTHINIVILRTITVTHGDIQPDMPLVAGSGHGSSFLVWYDNESNKCATTTNETTILTSNGRDNQVNGLLFFCSNAQLQCDTSARRVCHPTPNKHLSTASDNQPR